MRPMDHPQQPPMPPGKINEIRAYQHRHVLAAGRMLLSAITECPRQAEGGAAILWDEWWKQYAQPAILAWEKAAEEEIVDP
jgi:hypothetical protein